MYCLLELLEPKQQDFSGPITDECIDKFLSDANETQLDPDPFRSTRMKINCPKLVFSSPQSLVRDKT